MIRKFAAASCLLLFASGAQARPRCPRGTRRATVREHGGLVRLCVKRAKAWSTPPVRHGPARAYYKSGRRRWVAHFKDGVLDGPYRAWKRSGAKKAIGSYKDGKPDGEWTKWFRNSSDRGLYVAGNKQGKWVTELYEGGRIEGKYAAGRREGPWRTYAANGRLVLERFFDEGGRPTGTWRGFFEDGRRRLEGTWVDGRRMGTWQSWYPSGRHEWQRVYRPSGPGQVRRWHPGGVLRLRGQYLSNGDRVGLWETFYEEGKPRSRTVYEHDIVISRRVFDRAGRLLREIPSPEGPGRPAPLRAERTPTSGTSETSATSRAQDGAKAGLGGTHRRHP